MMPPYSFFFSPGLASCLSLSLCPSHWSAPFLPLCLGQSYSLLKNQTESISLGSLVHPSASLGPRRPLVCAVGMQTPGQLETGAWGWSGWSEPVRKEPKTASRVWWGEHGCQGLTWPRQVRRGPWGRRSQGPGVLKARL